MLPLCPVDIFALFSLCCILFFFVTNKFDLIDLIFSREETVRLRCLLYGLLTVMLLLLLLSVAPLFAAVGIPSLQLQ